MKNHAAARPASKNAHLAAQPATRNSHSLVIRKNIEELMLVKGLQFLQVSEIRTDIGDVIS